VESPSWVLYLQATDNSQIPPDSYEDAVSDSFHAGGAGRACMDDLVVKFYPIDISLNFSRFVAP